MGAGFAGLYALHRLRGLGVSTTLFEAGSGVGGTWFWNCYPGARCDVESVDYSYSFSEELEQEWSWTERYPSQPEILRYLNEVADRFDLRRDIQLETRVTALAFDEEAGRWTLTTADGSSSSARYCIMATGCLSAAQTPDFPGLDSFAGDWYHTASWPRDGVDFTGKRVGVIGTGSTGIQVIPEIAAQADHLFVFQRTANFTVPTRNALMDPEFERALKDRYPAYRRAARESFFGVPVELPTSSALEPPPDVVREAYQTRWDAGGGIPLLFAYTDLLVDQAANDTVADFVRTKIRETVTDPALAERLCPQGFPLGAKRLCQDTDYYETYNRANVTLVDVRSTPIQELTPGGLRTSDAMFELDNVILATGFDAVTGALLAIDIRGRHGLRLREKWAGGPRSYLGLAISGFPNLFTITGPGSPSVLSNMVLSIEQHVDWIADCLSHLEEHGLASIEAALDAEDAWVDHVREVGDQTLFPKAPSWYVGANIPGKPRVLMPYVGGVGRYRQECDSVAANGYEGFLLGAPASMHAGRLGGARRV